MRRREFITLLGGVATAWPLAAQAQQRAGTPVAGHLSGRSQDDSSQLLAAFRQGLKEAGFIEDRNVAIDYRWGVGAPFHRHSDWHPAAPNVMPCRISVSP